MQDIKNILDKISKAVKVKSTNNRYQDTKKKRPGTCQMD